MADRPINLRDWQALAAVEGRLKVIVVPLEKLTGWLIDFLAEPPVIVEFPIKVGDRYWGREAWAPGYDHDPEAADGIPKVSVIYDADKSTATLAAPSYEFAEDWAYRFGADGDDIPKRSPVTMPRWASRITILPTSIRVCQVQDVTEEEARAAGATKRPKCSGYQNTYDGWSMDWSKVGALSRWALHGKDGEPAPLAESDISLGTPRFALANQWNIDHGVDFWERNPWVAVATADVHRRNIDSMEA